MSLKVITYTHEVDKPTLETAQRLTTVSLAITLPGF